ncbi:hypothetical protein BGZ60DRAFT_539736, partial [Tricladium varicosporioides]
AGLTTPFLDRGVKKSLLSSWQPATSFDNSFVSSRSLESIIQKNLLTTSYSRRRPNPTVRMIQINHHQSGDLFNVTKNGTTIPRDASKQRITPSVPRLRGCERSTC